MINKKNIYLMLFISLLTLNIDINSAEIKEKPSIIYDYYLPKAISQTSSAIYLYSMYNKALSLLYDPTIDKTLPILDVACFKIAENSDSSFLKRFSLLVKLSSTAYQILEDPFSFLNVMHQTNDLMRLMYISMHKKSQTSTDHADDSE